jgi:hypothetical protein
MPATSVAPFLLSSAAAERVGFPGGVVSFLATGEQTGERFALMEHLLPKGPASPLHVRPG